MEAELFKYEVEELPKAAEEPKSPEEPKSLEEQMEAAMAKFHDSDDDDNFSDAPDDLVDPNLSPAQPSFLSQPASVPQPAPVPQPAVPDHSPITVDDVEVPYLYGDDSPITGKDEDGDDEML
jgi:hypothetical protein